MVKQKLAIEETEKQLTKEVNRVLKSADEKLSPQLADLVVQQISTESQDRALSSRTQGVRRDLQSLHTDPHGQSELSSLPPKMMTYSQLKDDVEVTERRYRLLAEELERATMAAAKEPTSFVLLDGAFPPENKSAPANTRNVWLAMVVGLMLAIFVTFASENLRKGSTAG